jgi:hypothetical protein
MPAEADVTRSTLLGSADQERTALPGAASASRFRGAGVDRGR